MRSLAAVVLILILAAPSFAEQLLFAGGQWAALDRGTACEATTRSIRIAAKGKVQARAGFAFDSAGPRRGQFFAQLSRVARPGSTIILTVGDRPFLLAGRGDWAWSRDSGQEAAIISATRAAGGMRIQTRDRAGSRFTDRFLLDGAATAIDAAAAHCAGKMQRR